MKMLQDPAFIIRILTAAGYIVLGIFLFIRPYVISFLSREMTYGFAVVLMIYGLFRGYRAYQLFKEKASL